MPSNLLEKYKDYLNVAKKLQVAYINLEEAQTSFSTTIAEQCALFQEYSELHCLKLSLHEDTSIPNFQAEIRKLDERIKEIESEAPWLKERSKNSEELAEQFKVSENLLNPYITTLHEIMALKKQLITFQSEIGVALRCADIPESEKQQALNWSLENLADITTEIQQRDNALVGEFQQSLLERSKFFTQQPTEKLGKEKYRAMLETENDVDPSLKPAN